MKKSQSTSAANRRPVQASSTLNRKYVKRPSTTPRISKHTTSAISSTANVSTRGVVAPLSKDLDSAIKIKHTKKPDKDIAPPKLHPIAAKVRATQTTKESSAKTSRLSAKDRKDLAIKQALRSVSTMESKELKMDKSATNSKSSRKRQKKDRSLLGATGKRVALAITCAVACVALIAVVVNFNMPDLSVRVAALQTGIEASYPSYVPRDFALSDIASSEGKVVMAFSGPDSTNFTITEEKSSWDSAALLNNFVKEEWGDDYTTTHEQGITIYISGSDAAWVNGGVLYTIETTSGSLTKKQLRNIAVSL